MKKFLNVILGSLILCGLSTGTAQADPFPEKSVRLVVPYPPGGFNDTLARVSSEKLGKLWNQPVVVENKPGAGGMIGMTAAAKANPDGYTIHFSALTNQAIAQALVRFQTAALCLTALIDP